MSLLLPSGSFTASLWRPVRSLLYCIILAASVLTASVVQGQITGVKTIPGDYASVVAAVSALTTSGVGPGGVTINVLPGSGPYTGQIVIPAIAGTSAANPIIINGNGNTIQFSTLQSTKQIVDLNGVDYLTLNNFNIATLNTSYGWGIQIHNSSDYNTISNCIINMSNVTSTAQNNALGIGFSNSSSSTNGGDNGDYNQIINNTITGAYQSIFMAGTNAANITGNVISNNIVEDYYAYGIYIEYNNGTIIAGNDIRRPTRSTMDNKCTGILAETGSKNVVIDRNRIHDSHTGGDNAEFKGINFDGCDAAVGLENKITNNLIYKLNGATGDQYGLYNKSSNGTWYYHNTVVMDHAASTNGDTRAFYQDNVASNIKLYNNIFYITRGGNGNKHLMYYNTSSSTILSNNNDLYINAPAGTNRVGRYGNTECATLANWQAVNTNAYDQQSVSVNPLFMNPSSADFTPTNLALDNAGVPVGVSTDLNNNARSSTTPDMGSYEFLTVPFPLSVKLQSFNAVRKNEDVLVGWSVSDEKNMVSYIVERSADGITFNETGTVYAAGKASYELTDRNAVPAAAGNKLYYRLKMVESAGKMVYSNIAVVTLDVIHQAFSAFPNPFTENLTVTAPADKAGSYVILIKDINGRTVASQSAALSAGTNYIRINGLSEPAQGVYQVVADIYGKVETATVVK